MWWCRLPQYIQDRLSAGFNTLSQRKSQPLKDVWCLIFSLLVPTIFALWYLEWNKAHPTLYPLPLSMVHFGRVKTPTNFKFVFNSHGQESQLSKTVTAAWDAVPEPTRDLMLLCWSALNSVRFCRNKIVHPDVKLSSAASIFKYDFGEQFAYQQADVLSLANFLYDTQDD